MSQIKILLLSLLLVNAGVVVSSEHGCAFEVNPKDTSVKRNDENVELQCQPSSSLDFSIWEIFLDNGTFWTVTGSDPERQLSRNFEFVYDTGALRILSVQDYHAGKYRCRATKIIGARCIYYSNNATLTVRDDHDSTTPAPASVPQSCEFDVSPNDTTVDINDMNVELNCQPSVSATGFMDFSIWEIFLDNGTFWTVTGSDLDRQLDRGLEFVPSTGALRILKVQEFHAGTYRCRATGIRERCIYYSNNATVTIREPLLHKPVDVQSFCSHIIWRNPPNTTTCDDITSYDIRLANPDTNEEVIRSIDSSATFYSLHQNDDAFLKEDTTIVQVRVVKNQLLGEFSSPISLGCRGQLSVSDEINRVYSTEIGHNTAEDIPTGVYRCEIPNSSGTTQKLYISLITSGS